MFVLVASSTALRFCLSSSPLASIFCSPFRHFPHRIARIMAPCLSKLPSVCLEAIFKHVPLVDLFYSVGLVCTGWYKSRRTELMRRRGLRLIENSSRNFENANLNYYRLQECSYGTELIELVHRDDGSPWQTLESLEHIRFNCLAVPDGMQTIPFFSSFMNLQNITRLHLNLTRSTWDITKVIRLMYNLSEHLTELKLDISFSDDFNYEESEDDIHESAINLVDCINSLKSLEHLNLGLSNLHSHPPLLSCLSRLTSFAINANYFSSLDGWILPSIRRYAQNVTSIEMDNMIINIRSMLQFSAQLACKFKVLSVSYNIDGVLDEVDDMHAMSLFCARFTSLTKLVINRYSGILMPMTKLARCLCSLTQLVHLDSSFSDIPPIEAVQHEEDEDEEDNEQLITQVPSVRLLAIRLFYNVSHRDTERLFIPEIFPNLQVLRFDHTFVDCSDCEISRVDWFDPERARRIAECKRLARQPFRRCAHLHTVALVDSGEETLISLDDL